MKKIILATLAAAALVACAKEDVVVASKGEAIAFNNAFVDNTTKAIDPSITNDGDNALEGFVVYGTTKGDHDGAQTVNIFNGVNVGVNIDGIGDDWKYANNLVQYWIDGNIYDFAAVVNGTVTVTPDSNGMPATIAYNATSQTDLLYAEQKGIEGKKSGNGAVAFTFDHLLSKVKVTFNNTSKASEHNKYNYKVTNVQIVGTYASADYDLTATPQAWGVGTGSYTAQLGHIVAANANTEVTEALAIYHTSNGVSNYERLVIPGAYTALTVNCHIELYVGNVTTPVDVIEYSQPVQVTLEKGKCYNFILSAGVGEEIEFTVTQVNGWTPQGANGVETPVEVIPSAPEHDRTPETNN